MSLKFQLNCDDIDSGFLLRPQKPESRFSAAERKFKEKKLEKERQIKVSG